MSRRLFPKLTSDYFYIGPLRLLLYVSTCLICCRNSHSSFVQLEREILGRACFRLPALYRWQGRHSLLRI